MDISGIFVASRLGDLLIARDFLFDETLNEILPEFTNRIFNEEDDDDDDDDGEEDRRLLPRDAPFFTFSSIHVYFISRNDLYFVQTSRHAHPPVLPLEFLSILFDLCCDFCGVAATALDAGVLRRNAVLVLEILDEVVCNGQAQVLKAEKLKPFVRSPRHVSPPASTTALRRSSAASAASAKSLLTLASLIPSSAKLASVLPTGTSEIVVPSLFATEYAGLPSTLTKAVRSLASSAQNLTSVGDIFVDVVERVSLKSSAEGALSVFRVDGRLLVETRLKSGLSPPKIKLFFDKDLVLSGGGGGGERGYGKIYLDDCVFSRCCGTERLFGRAEGECPELIVDSRLEEGTKSAKGEGNRVVALTYRVGGEFARHPPPFTVAAKVESDPGLDPFERRVSVALETRYPPRVDAARIALYLPVPSYVTEVVKLADEASRGVDASMRFDRKNSRIHWTIRNLPGKTCVNLGARLKWRATPTSTTTTDDAAAFQLSVGPAFIEFELSGFCQSGFKIDALKLVVESSTSRSIKDLESIKRWIRCVTLQGEPFLFFL